MVEFEVCPWDNRSDGSEEIEKNYGDFDIFVITDHRKAINFKDRLDVGVLLSLTTKKSMPGQVIDKKAPYATPEDFPDHYIIISPTDVSNVWVARSNHPKNGSK